MRTIVLPYALLQRTFFTTPRVNMVTSILFVWIVNQIWICSGYDITASQVTGNEVSATCLKALHPVLFTQKVKDKLKMVLPTDELFWIGAKSAPTDYVVWKGCHEMGLFREPFKTVANNSIQNCIKYTGCVMGSTVVLKDDRCFCLFTGFVKDYFQPSSFRSSPHHCEYNPNEECGCNNGGYSLYGLSREVDEYIEYIIAELPTGLDRACLTKTWVWSKNRGNNILELNKVVNSRNCEDKTITSAYQCWNASGSWFYKNAAKLSWIEARRRCHERRMELGEVGRSFNSSSQVEHWTAIRRSFSLVWDRVSGKETDSQCVAVTKDIYGTIRLIEMDCSKRHRAVCERSEGTTFPVWAVVLPIFVLLVVGAVVLYVVVMKRRKAQKQSYPTVNNRFYDQVVCSSTRSHEHMRAQVFPGGNGASGRDSSIYHTIDTEEEHGGEKVDGTRYLTFAQSNVSERLVRSESAFNPDNASDSDDKRENIPSSKSPKYANISLDVDSKASVDGCLAKKNPYETIHGITSPSIQGQQNGGGLARDTNSSDSQESESLNDKTRSETTEDGCPEPNPYEVIHGGT